MCDEQKLRMMTVAAEGQKVISFVPLKIHLNNSEEDIVVW